MVSAGPTAQRQSVSEPTPKNGPLEDQSDPNPPTEPIAHPQSAQIERHGEGKACPTPSLSVSKMEKRKLL